MLPLVKKLKTHGKSARFTKHDEVSPELVEFIASVPLTPEQKDIVTPKHPRIVEFERRLAISQLLQAIRRERSE